MNRGNEQQQRVLSKGRNFKLLRTDASRLARYCRLDNKWSVRAWSPCRHAMCTHSCFPLHCFAAGGGALQRDVLKKLDHSKHSFVQAVDRHFASDKFSFGIS